MGRDDHHCPGRDGPVGNGPNQISAGGCRIRSRPVHHCEKHQNYCVRHKTAFMKLGGACPSCLGEKNSKHKRDDRDDDDGDDEDDGSGGGKSKKRKANDNNNKGSGGNDSKNTSKGGSGIKNKGGSGQKVNGDSGKKVNAGYTNGIRKPRPAFVPKTHHTRGYTRKLAESLTPEDFAQLEEEERLRVRASVQNARVQEKRRRLQQARRRQVNQTYTEALKQRVARLREGFKNLEEHEREEEARAMGASLEEMPDVQETAALQEPAELQETADIEELEDYEATDIEEEDDF